MTDTTPTDPAALRAEVERLKAENEKLTEIAATYQAIIARFFTTCGQASNEATADIDALLARFATTHPEGRD